MPLTLYGHYVSQPTRSIAWLLAMKAMPYTFKKLDPTAGDAENPEYLAVCPTGLVPALDDDGFVLFESGAILTYLCEANKWHDYYPVDAKARGEIQQYLHWHHANTRLITLHLFRPKMMMILGKAPPQLPANSAKSIAFVLQMLDQHFLSPHKHFLTQGSHPTIADLQCYCELDQVEAMALADLSPYPKVKEWMGHMKQLPEHDAVRVSLNKLAQLAQKQEKR